MAIESQSPHSMTTTLDKSRDEKKGVTMMFNGQTVAMVVTEVGTEFVIGRNQQFDRVVVRIEKIDAVSM